MAAEPLMRAPITVATAMERFAAALWRALPSFAVRRPWHRPARHPAAVRVLGAGFTRTSLFSHGQHRTATRRADRRGAPSLQAGEGISAR
jgi:hypothetical protein